jgi:DNA helicase-2/ATP-dependent DNA helicase PcrA
LAQGHQNICCVGDEDQSIYGWRGAEIGNILRFEQDFPGAQVIRLEQNYRSTGHILSAASHLIAKNAQRLGKTLWTSAEPGEKVRVQTLWDGEEEARWVADEIESLQRQRVGLNQVAVMVRAGFQTRQFEERFITLGIPYRVLVGARFYERQEIRDTLAYLRLLVQPEDDLAFERIVNTPKRGIGPAAIQQLYSFGRAAKVSLSEATARLVETDELKPKLRSSLRTLSESFARWRLLLQTLPHPEVAQIVLDESGYTGMWQADKSPEAPGRLENLKELVSALAEFDTLPAFLEHVSLVLEATEKSNDEQVSLMTLHGAKGLEFENVFLPGWEEEIFPSRMSLSENGNLGLEEERRLAYVGITRARVRAFISHVANRHLHGSWINALPSRFLAELPDANIDRRSSINFGGQGGNNSWQRERKERVPPLWEQLRAGQMSRDQRGIPPRLRPTEIEGKAYEVKPHRREGKLNVGDRVFHEKFGNGTVRRVDHDKLEIAFDKAGLKKVMENFVRPVN